MMKQNTTRVLVTIPTDLLKKIDAMVKKAGMDRAAFICKTVESKLFADEVKEMYRRRRREDEDVGKLSDYDWHRYTRR